MSNGYDTEQLPDDDANPDQAPEILDAGEPGFRRQRLSKAALEYLELERFWQAVFASPFGRKQMWDILRQAGAFDDRFGVGPNGFPQPEQSWFHMGARSLGLRLFRTWSKYAREGVMLMQDENDKFLQRPKMPQREKERDS
jgi:hypothetical protein